ncbi:hypothetical protein QMA09_16745 [Planococcus sp. APC 3906]|uniref:hypothetical protein n=1 Tax=Planococcus sp. APC 3906 TaxID=3035194 RepID=UPI0025B4332B|nr:hypothetical protein [Planococcus sp. APC 3906]MDN3451840.1 hypothetical protein [Planococcus sp. APC 3906]
MSMIQNKGESIIQATNLLKETYGNLSILFQELDRVGEEEGYMTITPRFMRYKSDTDTTGWLTTNFIKIYVKSSTMPSSIEDIRELPWYGVMVDLTDDGEEKIPMLSIIRYKFDQSHWNRLPAVSDHWTFWSPFYEEEFDIFHEGNKWTVSSKGQAKKKHSGFEKLKAIDIPLFDVKSPEDIRLKIFGELEKLDL